MQAYARDTRIVPAGLGKRAPLVGAAAVAWRGLGEELFAESVSRPRSPMAMSEPAQVFCRRAYYRGAPDNLRVTTWNGFSSRVTALPCSTATSLKALSSRSVTDAERTGKPNRSIAVARPPCDS